ncbi:hypothetical protein G7Y79_00002g005510 [Physcia stellaris]|nr:hypothetical protein G7Y79_00002g005510 [Physcia stellaris]
MNQTGSFPKLWASALKLYQKGTGRDLQSDPHTLSIQSLEDLRDKIEKSNTDFTGFREKHERFWKVLSAVCAPIQVMGGLARDVAAATQIVPACAAFGAIFYLITAAKGVSEAYDDVEGLLARIAGTINRFEVYDQGTIDQSLGMLVAETMCKILEILGRAEKLARRSRTQEYFRNALLGKDEKLKGLLDDLERLSSEEARLVLALDHTSNQRIEKAVGELHMQISQSNADTNTESERREIYAALDGELSDRMYKIYNSIRRDRTRSTSDWILEDPMMQAWLGKSSAFLWILGVGGIGKSFLSARIIGELDECKAPAESVAYCYIKNDNQSSGSINTILRCIAFQLAMQNNEYRSFVTIVCKDHARLRVSEDTWENLFEAYFLNDHCHGGARVVIDGVDETSPQQQSVLFRLMQKLYRQPPQRNCRLQFLLLGRPEIVAQWPDSAPAYVEVTPLKMSKDVRRYVKENITRVKLLESRDIAKGERKALRQLIIERLQQSASGMFLWVKLMLDEIMFQPRPSDIRRILESPPSLIQLLDNILERIVKDPSGSGKDLKEILLWTSFAQRELYLGEIKLILELNEPVGEGLPGLETYLREDYRSLFVLERTDGKTTEDLRRIAAFSHKDGNARGLDTSSDDDSGEEMDNESDYHSDGESTDEELDHGRPFNSDLSTTKVRIGHSMIREYMTRGHSKKNNAINVDPVQAHTHIAMTSSSRSGTVATMCQDDVDAIAFRLSFIMYDSEALSRIVRPGDDADNFLTTIFADEVVSKLQQWIALAHPPQGSLAELQWRNSAPSSIIALLSPLANIIAKSWLQEMPMKGQTGRKYINFNIAFLHAYQCLEMARSEANIAGTEYHWKSPSTYDVDELHNKQICQVAMHTNLPQNSLWYRDYTQSIKMGIAGLSLEAGESPLDFGTWSWMASSAARIGTSDNTTLEWARKNLGVHAKSTRGTLFIIHSLYVQRRRLYQFLPYLNTYLIAVAAVFAKKEDRAIVIAKNLAEAAEKANNFREIQISKYLHGLICFILKRDYDTPMDILEGVRSDLEFDERGTQLLPLFYPIVRMLSYLYFEKAIEARKAGESTAVNWIEKLESLVRKRSSISPGQIEAGSRDADDSVTATLALWYRLEGNTKACEKLLEARFYKGIQILQDKDIHNDAYGYETLSTVLFRAGNCDQAIAALTPLIFPLSREQERLRQYERNRSLPLTMVTDHENQRLDSRDEPVSEKNVLDEVKPLSNTGQRDESQIREIPEIMAGASDFDLTEFMSQESSRPGLPLITRIDDNVNIFACRCRCRIIDELWVYEVQSYGERPRKDFAAKRLVGGVGGKLDA